VGQSFCYFSTLHHATAGLTALLLYLYPALVTLVSAALGRQRLTWSKAALAGLSLLGILLTVAGDLGGSAAGLGFGVGSAVIYTGYILVGEGVIPRVGAIAASTVVMLAAAAVYACAALAAGPQWPTQVSGWLAVVGIALVATVIPIIGFFAGMQRLGAADAATLSTLEPVVTLLLAFVFLNETLAPVQLLGAGAVVAAVALLSRMR
jgi:drug/metabolite transporter (DMT)-like permease